MTTVFIAGSISIKQLHPLFLERLNTIVTSDFDVVVGDADGADRSIQQALLERGARHVTVYCSGCEPRNNVGAWQVRTVSSSSSPGSRAFFTAKDIEMAKVADYGLMMWDAKSTGTLSNVIELLKRRRSSRVFVNKIQGFITASDVDGLKRLVSVMSEGARAKAEDKIGLSAKVGAITQRQLDLTFQEAQPLPPVEVESSVFDSVSPSYEAAELPASDPAEVTLSVPNEHLESAPDTARHLGRDDLARLKRMPRVAKAILIALLLLLVLGSILLFRG